MFPLKLLQQAHTNLVSSAGRDVRPWSDGPLSGLAGTLSRLPGVEICHVEHGSVAESGRLTPPWILVSIENPYIATLIGRSIQRPGTYAATRLEWTIRHVGDIDHPWLERIKDLDHLEDWEEKLWWIHPLGEPGSEAGQREWLEDAYQDYESGEVLCAYILLHLEGELARRRERRPRG